MIVYMDWICDCVRNINKYVEMMYEQKLTLYQRFTHMLYVFVLYNSEGMSAIVTILSM